MNSISTIIIILIHFSIIQIYSSITFHTETQTTRLINRTIFDSITECSIRLGGKQFTLKFYRMITCRYVNNLSSISSYLFYYSNQINALEIIDSKISYWNVDEYGKILRKFEYLIFYRTIIINYTKPCLFNPLSRKLFYLHLTQFSPSLDRLFSNQSCFNMKRLHVLILDQTNLGDENILLKYFTNLHILRLNFSSFHRPLTYSYLRSFVYLQDFLLNVNDDCHRCEYEWLKYAARDDNYVLYRISPYSGCMDWNQGKIFVKWHDAPLCGSCFVPLINKKICRIEDGITEHYCRAFYGRESLFQLWTDSFSKKIISINPILSTMRPTYEFMKSKYTKSINERMKRDINQTLSMITPFPSVINDTNVIPEPLLTNATTIATSTISSWQQSRLVVTRNPTDLFNRSYCPSINDSIYRPKLRLNLPSLIDQLWNISEQYTPNCSRIQCDIIQLDYRGPLCLKNGHTYANICEVLYALCTKQIHVNHSQIDYFGSCVSNCSHVSRCYYDNEICVMTPKPHCISRQRNCSGYAPVCDIYGKTFINRCHLTNSLKFNQPRQMAYRGPCLLNRQCQINLCQKNEICVQTQDQYHYPVCINCQLNETMNSCPFELFCGDNQRQYINRCQLHYERCQMKTFIQIEYFGLCRHEMNNEDEMN